MQAVPAEARTVLSVGCGLGDNEAALRKAGKSVCAIPLDAVFGASLQYRGIRTAVGPLEAALEQLSGEAFDAILLPDVLHLVDDPVDWLRRLGGHLAPEGKLIARLANTGELMSRIRDLRSAGKVPQTSGAPQKVNARRLQKWCKEAGLKTACIVPVVEETRNDARKWAVRKLGPAFASRLILTATHAGSAR